MKPAIAFTLIASLLAPSVSHAVAPVAAAQVDFQNSAEIQNFLQYSHDQMQTQFLSLSTKKQSAFLIKTEAILVKVQKRIEKMSEKTYQRRYKRLSHAMVNQVQQELLEPNEVIKPSDQIEQIDAEYQNTFQKVGLAVEKDRGIPQVSAAQVASTEVRQISKSEMIEKVKESLQSVRQYQLAKQDPKKISRAPASLSDIFSIVLLVLPLLVSIAVGIIFAWTVLLIIGIGLVVEVAWLYFFGKPPIQPAGIG